MSFSTSASASASASAPAGVPFLRRRWGEGGGGGGGGGGEGEDLYEQLLLFLYLTEEEAHIFVIGFNRLSCRFTCGSDLLRVGGWVGGWQAGGGTPSHLHPSPSPPSTNNNKKIIDEMLVKVNPISMAVQ